MRIDSSGNVGIGTSSPSTKLSVTDNGSGIRGITVTNTTASSISDRTRFNLVNGSYTFGLDAIGGVSDTGFYYQSNGAAGHFFYTNGAERMRIDSSGNLLVGTAVSEGPSRLSVVAGSNIACVGMRNTQGAGNPFARFINSGDTAVIGSISNNGNTATAYNTSSDYRLKHDIQPMTGALAKVAQLKPVTYKWNIDDSQSQGFIAHELQEVVPECVTGEKDAVDADGNPQYQGIDTSVLVATLTAAIQELKAELDTVKAELETLKGN
jgi:hypothetical protein